MEERGLIQTLEEGRDGCRTHSFERVDGGWCVCVPRREQVTELILTDKVAGEAFTLLNQASYEVCGKKWTMVEAECGFTMNMDKAKKVYERAIELAQKLEPHVPPTPVDANEFQAMLIASRQTLALPEHVSEPAALPAPVVTGALPEFKVDEGVAALWSRAIPVPGEKEAAEELLANRR